MGLRDKLVWGLAVWYKKRQIARQPCVYRAPVKARAPHVTGSPSATVLPMARGHLTTSAERTCDSMRFTATLRRFIAPSKHKMPPLSREERTNACMRLASSRVPDDAFRPLRPRIDLWPTGHCGSLQI